MTLRLLAQTFSAADPAAAAAFWSALLGRQVVDDADGLLLPGSATQAGLRFAPETSPRDRPNRVHLHVTSDHAVTQQHVVDTALDLGAHPLDVGQLAEEPHVVLADPDGNEFCVINQGNRFLAGTGLLGELAGDGTRELGLFWSAALDWPLVWDSDGETAIQAVQPDGGAGGTKVAWGGPPIDPPDGRQWLELESDDVGTDTDRLITLGATRQPSGSLTDPDGAVFVLRSG